MCFLLFITTVHIRPRLKRTRKCPPAGVPACHGIWRHPIHLAVARHRFDLHKPRRLNANNSCGFSTCSMSSAPFRNQIGQWLMISPLHHASLPFAFSFSPHNPTCLANTPTNSSSATQHDAKCRPYATHKLGSRLPLTLATPQANDCQALALVRSQRVVFARRTQPNSARGAHSTSMQQRECPADIAGHQLPNDAWRINSYAGKEKAGRNSCKEAASISTTYHFNSSTCLRPLSEEQQR